MDVRRTPAATTHRVLSALETSPMSATELSQALSVTYETARTATNKLLAARRVRVIGYDKRAGHGAGGRVYARNDMEETGMLILTRRQGESIMVGDDVVIHVSRIDGDQVRIGIEAPRSVPVHREEIYRRIEAVRTREATR